MGDRRGRTLAAGALAVGLLSGGLACGPHHSSADRNGHTVPAPGQSKIGGLLPRVTVAPSVGQPGTHVTIAGHGFTDLVAVCFGQRAATGVQVDASGTQLSAIAPAGRGTVLVYVDTRAGYTLPASFRYTSGAVSGAASPSAACKDPP
jgi:IPT/TIG domain